MNLMNTLDDFLLENSTHTKTIHCIGDSMIDEYYKVKVDRISPEFPMPIMVSESDQPIRKPGGAANVACQLKHFNAFVELMCFYSHPEVLRRENMYFSRSIELPWYAQLPIKKRFLDNNIQVKRWDIEKPCYGLDRETHESMMEDMLNLYATSSKADVAILSDYNKGFFNDYYAQRWIHTLSERGTIIIVDPKKGPLEKWKGCTVFKANAAEAKELTGFSDPEQQAGSIVDRTRCKHAIITNSDNPICFGTTECISPMYYFYDQSKRKVRVSSVVGAGDTFCAILGLALAHNMYIDKAITVADEASKIYVEGNMNRPIYPLELNPSKVVRPSDLKNRDFKLVFTNGCFDILHSGHIKLLKKAKSRGDKLVVALNSDASIKRLKGDSRPILPFEDRCPMLCALDMVDYVTFFDEDTPLEVIKQCNPDVLVKGGDYKVEDVVGHDLVKETYIVPLVEGMSTTELIRRAKS